MNAKHAWAKAASILAIFALLALLGCLYPDHLRSENQLSPKESTLLVQNAVNEYKKATGVLPIKMKPVDTPLYEKYPIDFKKLLDSPFLNAIPGIAFENGGRAIFVLIDVEQNPQVKLIDLPSYETVQRVQEEVSRYNAANRKLPTGDRPLPGFYRIDYAALGIPEEKVKSVYSGQNLPLLMHESGQVAIDNAADIMRLVEKHKLTGPTGDLRDLLVRESYFVPVTSFPYRWIDKEPRPVAP